MRQAAVDGDIGSPTTTLKISVGSTNLRKIQDKTLLYSGKCSYLGLLTLYKLILYEIVSPDV